MTKTCRMLIAAAAAIGCAGAAGAAELQKIGTIEIPGEPLTSFDISYVDQQTQRYYLADRSNKSLDVFDAKAEKFIGRVGGFVGLKLKPDGKPNNEISGPNGVSVWGDEAWVSDGDSTVKVIDLKAMKVVDTISLGGKARGDESAFDPKDQVYIVGSGDDDPPFATVISTKPGHKIIAKLTFPDATDGAEQPDWNAADGNFYMSIPELKGAATRGGVAVISPEGKLAKMMRTSYCHANGLAFGPNQDFMLGCTAHDKEGMGAEMLWMNAQSGDWHATPGIGGADMVAYSAKNGQYYSASSNQLTGHVLGVFNAKTYQIAQKIDVKGGSPHSVAVNESNGHVYLPVGKPEGGCGCIEVYALK